MTRTPEPETILQPSLHTLEDYADIMIGEAEAWAAWSKDAALIDRADTLRTEYDALTTDDDESLSDDDYQAIDEMTNDAEDLIRESGAYVYSEPGDSFVASAVPLEPDADDITTEDGVTFYQSGRLYLDCRGRHVNVAARALRMTMRRDGFYPNVWTISDHGNAHLWTADDR